MWRMAENSDRDAKLPLWPRIRIHNEVISDITLMVELKLSIYPRSWTSDIFWNDSCYFWFVAYVGHAFLVCILLVTTELSSSLPNELSKFISTPWNDSWSYLRVIVLLCGLCALR